MIFICGRYAEVRPVANSDGSETFPADTVSSDMVPKPVRFVPTYLFAILCHLNRYETHLNLKHFIFSTVKTHLCHFQPICWFYNRGLLLIFFGCNFFLDSLLCSCLNLAMASFTQASFFFSFDSLAAFSLCFCFTI